MHKNVTILLVIRQAVLGRRHSNYRYYYCYHLFFVFFYYYYYYCCYYYYDDDYYYCDGDDEAAATAALASSTAKAAFGARTEPAIEDTRNINSCNSNDDNADSRGNPTIMMLLVPATAMPAAHTCPRIAVGRPRCTSASDKDFSSSGSRD